MLAGTGQFANLKGLVKKFWEHLPGTMCIGIPIIAMTANAMKGDDDRCLEAGMDDCIAKPIDATMLQKKIDHWISKTIPASNPTIGQYQGNNIITDLS
jgi:DNA-binding response OmpR family regulator